MNYPPGFTQDDHDRAHDGIDRGEPAPAAKPEPCECGAPGLHPYPIGGGWALACDRCKKKATRKPLGLYSVWATREAADTRFADGEDWDRWRAEAFGEKGDARMNMHARFPLPWTVHAEDETGGLNVKDATGGRIFLGYLDPDVHTPGEAEALVVTIVAAVNAARHHDELVGALEMVRDADNDCHKDGLQTIPSTARRRIDAVLAKVEG